MGWKPIHIPDKAETAALQKDFGRRARFLVDESVGVDVARLLSRSGWNAKHVGDVGLLGRDDEEIMASAMREDRVLLTYDRDFLDARRFPEHRNPGVVLLPGSQGDVVALIEALRWTLSIVGEFREVWRKSVVQIGAGGEFVVRSRKVETGVVTTKRYRLVLGNGVDIWNNTSA